MSGGFFAQILDHRLELVLDFFSSSCTRAPVSGLTRSSLDAVHRLDDVLVGPVVDDAAETLERLPSSSPCLAKSACLGQLNQADGGGVLQVAGRVTLAVVDLLRVYTDLLLLFQQFHVRLPDRLLVLLVQLVDYLLKAFGDLFLRVDQGLERIRLLRIGIGQRGLAEG